MLRAAFREGAPDEAAVAREVGRVYLDGGQRVSRETMNRVKACFT